MSESVSPQPKEVVYLFGGSGEAGALATAAKDRHPTGIDQLPGFDYLSSLGILYGSGLGYCRERFCDEDGLVIDVFSYRKVPVWVQALQRTRLKFGFVVTRRPWQSGTA